MHLIRYFCSSLIGFDLVHFNHSVERSQSTLSIMTNIFSTGLCTGEFLTVIKLSILMPIGFRRICKGVHVCIPTGSCHRYGSIYVRSIKQFLTPRSHHSTPSIFHGYCSSPKYPHSSAQQLRWLALHYHDEYRHRAARKQSAKPGDSQERCR